jgi:hypothetical protein
VLRSLGSHCPPEVNKPESARHLHQIKSEFWAHSSVLLNSRFGFVLTESLIQHLATTRGNA